MTRDQALAILGELYTKTGMDWHLKLNHCLTEPTCPTAYVVPSEFSDLTVFRYDADTIERAIDGALTRAAVWASGGDAVPGTPFTRGFLDDEILALCLRHGEHSRAEWEKARGNVPLK